MYHIIKAHYYNQAAVSGTLTHETKANDSSEDDDNLLSGIASSSAHETSVKMENKYISHDSGDLSKRKKHGAENLKFSFSDSASRQSTSANLKGSNKINPNKKARHK